MLDTACRFQELVPGSTLVGGCAAIYYAEHRLSFDADHWKTNLIPIFDDTRDLLESTQGWETEWAKQPYSLLGRLNGVKVGVREMSRAAPLELITIDYKGKKLVIPTEAEITRIKSMAVIQRGATRDYLNLAALFEKAGSVKTSDALRDLDRIYPLENGESALRLLQSRLSQPKPMDLHKISLGGYKNVIPKWRKWENIAKQLTLLAFDLSDSPRLEEKPSSFRPRP
ncbi:MAG: hypothetical protein LBO66_11640 [Deltaproteobacteria bacterium]|jgi:hypothetical protein|nr:hypothetical protein [Deltaproteobacteria bacterium]